MFVGTVGEIPNKDSKISIPHAHKHMEQREINLVIVLKDPLLCGPRNGFTAAPSICLPHKEQGFHFVSSGLATRSGSRHAEEFLVSGPACCPHQYLRKMVFISAKTAGLTPE